MASQKMGKAVIRGGVHGHMVNVKANKRFVRSTYPGTDPRTKAKHRK